MMLLLGSMMCVSEHIKARCASNADCARSSRLVGCQAHQLRRAAADLSLKGRASRDLHGEAMQHCWHQY
eukprot:scaffold199270_cov31-Tisochrysis_lutea.AAC.3